MDEILTRKLNAYKTAFRLVRDRSAEVKASANPDVDWANTLRQEFTDAEAAYHYANRYLHFYTPAPAGMGAVQRRKDAVRASVELSFRVITGLVERGADGVGYNADTGRFYALPGGDVNWNSDEFLAKWPRTQTFPWVSNPWYILAATERMAGSIRRVKATTEAEVLDRLFVKLSDS